MTRILAGHPLAANCRNFRREHSLSRAVGTAGPERDRAIMGAVQRFIVTIEAPNWKDVEDLELPQLPAEGDAIETKYGTCIVTQAEPSPDSEQYAGKMVCRLP